MSDEAPFRVLGIALVVEERGKGSRLVFRYPAVPSGLEDCNDADNLFFTLPARTMAKIFRPKSPLCDQPMTISLGGTIFCCRAVLMSPEHTKSSSALVLFSVVVSLIPSVQTSDLPISGWYEREIIDPTSNTRSSSQSSKKDSNRSLQEDAEIKKIQLKASNSFLAVRQIHVSLSRLCRVLAREELRCRYVAVQSAQLQQIRAAFKANREKIKSANYNHSASAITINASTSEIGKRRHRRTMTGGSIGGGGSSTIVTEMAMDRDDDKQREIETRKRQQRDQEVTDLMLAAKVEGAQIHGNLARELLQVFHALSQTNQSSTPTSSAILSARDSTVFINRHLAVPIESVAKDLCQVVNPVLRPYHTLLFPQVTALELAESFTSSNSRMKQFLSILDPGKALSDIARESSIPLPMVMEMATYLIKNRICMISHVINKWSVLACCHDAVLRMRDLALQFSQLFRHLSIHCVVSVLTRGWSIEELIERLSIDNDFEVELVGGVFQELVEEVRNAREDENRKLTQKAQDEEEKQVIQDSFGVQELGMVNSASLGNAGGNSSHENLQDDEDALSPFVVAISALEDFIVAMATWLGAHRIIIPKAEYLLSGNIGVESRSSLAYKGRARSYEDLASSRMNHLQVEETLYKELRDEGGLNGNISVVALRWRFGLDETTLRRLRRWGLRAGKIRSIVRVPNLADDEWGSTE